MYVKFKFDEDKDLILVLIEKECNAISWAKDYRFSRLILILRRLFVLKKVLQIISAAAGLLFLFSCAQAPEFESTEESMDTSFSETEYVPSRIIKIACVGSSTTYGFQSTDPITKSYPAVLQSLLGDKYEVKNFGRSRAFMIDRLEYPDFTYSSDKSVAYKNTSEYKNSMEYDPDIVLICLGGNDAHASNKNKEVDQETYFYESAVALVSEYQNLPSKPTVYLMYPPSRFDSNYRRLYLRDTILPLIDKAVDATKCETIDLFNLTDPYALYNDKTYFNADGNHFTDEGYALIAQCIYDVVSLYRID